MKWNVRNCILSASREQQQIMKTKMKKNTSAVLNTCAQFERNKQQSFFHCSEFEFSHFVQFFFYANVFYVEWNVPFWVHKNCDENNKKKIVKIYSSNKVTSLRPIFLNFIKKIMKRVKKIIFFFQSKAFVHCLCDVCRRSHSKRQSAWIYVKISHSKVERVREHERCCAPFAHSTCTDSFVWRCCGKYWRISKDFKE